MSPKLVAVTVSSLFLVGCAKPTLESIRPRGLDVFVSGGKARDRSFGEETVHGSMWQVGATLSWNITYEDEKESTE